MQSQATSSEKYYIFMENREYQPRSLLVRHKNQI
jgi:hypothetical protein